MLSRGWGALASIKRSDIGHPPYDFPACGSQVALEDRTGYCRISRPSVHVTLPSGYHRRSQQPRADATRAAPSPKTNVPWPVPAARFNISAGTLYPEHDAVRPCPLDVPDAELADLRRASTLHGVPNANRSRTIARRSARHLQTLATIWGTRVRRASGAGAQPQCSAPLHHRDLWTGLLSSRSCSNMTIRCRSSDHAWMSPYRSSSSSEASSIR